MTGPDASKMKARTPGPWSVGDTTGRMVVREVPGMCDGGDYYSVAVTTAHSLLSVAEAKANAAFIVEACNQYDELERRVDIAEQMAAALRACQFALAMVIAPDAIKSTSVLHAFTQATEAECKARAALSAFDASNGDRHD